MNTKAIFVGDIVEENGKSIKENNLEKKHNFPIGSLVEICCSCHSDNGLRLFVMSHSRDCDGEPLYELTHDAELIGKTREDFENEKLKGLAESNDVILQSLVISDYFKKIGAVNDGWGEESLRLIRLPYIVATRIDDGVKETFRNIREEMGEPGPMSFDDHDQRMVNANKLCENGVQPLIPIEKPQLPIAVTHPIYLSKEDQIKANAETVDVFFPDKEDKPLPKVVTIEVTGLPGVGKTVLLQMIDDAIQAKFDIVPLCAELEDEGRQINVNEISQQLIDDYRSGKIIIEMRERTIKPKAFSHECPC